MDRRKGLAIAAASVLLFGLIFMAVGGGVFAGLALPEIRDFNFARNADYPVYSATITHAVRSSTMVNGEWRYRVVFSCDDGIHHGRSAPVYSHRSAEAMVGNTIDIRVSENGRAVPVDFQTSARSTVGWVFLPVFGGIGLVAILTAVGLMLARGKIDSRWE
ncbi:MAG: hypothetical protein FWE40_02600 [Oscillospiraceae bacterium]|jgi:hypothetical protein|nr:hypothetical protein [Oscillospiraceae bacterium]